jgi:hypothetical protein
MTNNYTLIQLNDNNNFDVISVDKDAIVIKFIFDTMTKTVDNKQGNHNYIITNVNTETKCTIYIHGNLFNSNQLIDLYTKYGLQNVGNYLIGEYSLIICEENDKSITFGCITSFVCNYPIYISDDLDIITTKCLENTNHVNSSTYTKLLITKNHTTMSQSRYDDAIAPLLKSTKRLELNNTHILKCINNDEDKKVTNEDKKKEKTDDIDYELEYNKTLSENILLRCTNIKNKKLVIYDNEYTKLLQNIYDFKIINNDTKLNNEYILFSTMGADYLQKPISTDFFKNNQIKYVKNITYPFLDIQCIKLLMNKNNSNIKKDIV